MICSAIAGVQWSEDAFKADDRVVTGSTPRVLLAVKHSRAGPPSLAQERPCELRLVV